MKRSPIKRELLRNALEGIADNMMVTVIRTSRSMVVKSNLDFSAGIFDGAGVMVKAGMEFNKRTRVNDTELLHYAVSRKIFRVDE